MLNVDAESDVCHQGRAYTMLQTVQKMYCTVLFMVLCYTKNKIASFS